MHELDPEASGRIQFITLLSHLQPDAEPATKDFLGLETIPEDDGEYKLMSAHYVISTKQNSASYRQGQVKCKKQIEQMRLITPKSSIEYSQRGSFNLMSDNLLSDDQSPLLSAIENK